MARPSHWERRLSELLPELTQFALRLVCGNENKADAAVSDAIMQLLEDLREQPRTRLKRRKEPLIFADDAAFVNWCRARVATLASKRYGNTDGDTLRRDLGGHNDSKFRDVVRKRATRRGRKVTPQGEGPDEHVDHQDWCDSLR